MTTEYLFTQKTYYELQKRRIFFYAGLAVLGIIGIVLFIIFYPITDYNSYLILEFVPSLAFALIGIFYNIAIIVMIHRLKEVEVRFTYAFNKDSLKAKSYNEQGELTSDSEVAYDRIMKYKDTGVAFFLYLPNKKVLPLASDDPKLEEIKKIIHIDDIPRKKI